MSFDFSKPVALGADHAGYAYKDALVKHLKEKGYTVKDFGTNGPDSVDYPDFAHQVARAVDQGEAAMGILFCGSAVGVSVVANKHAGVRAALCWDNEIARLSRMHNNANVICMPARFVALEYARQMTDTFMNTAFEGGRHQGRVDKIACPV